jgi:putative hydrolase of HD superfamily
MDELHPNDEQLKVSSADGIAGFLSVVGRLKSTTRTGWLDRGMSPEAAESVADHSFRVALLAWVAAGLDPTLVRSRVLILALIHDLAEAVTGDQTPYSAEAAAAVSTEGRDAFLNLRHIPDEERRAAKLAAEAAAIVEMTRHLPEPIRSEFAALWRELEEKSTAEALFVKQADRLETYLQSIEYKAGIPNLPVESFAAEVAETIDNPGLVELRDAIRRLGLSEPGRS